MQVSANGLKLIEVFESLSLTPYLDSNRIWTVGWGHALKQANGHLISEKDLDADMAKKLMVDSMQRTFGKQAISAAEAEIRLKKDVSDVEDFLNKHVAANTTQAQFDAMACFAFNARIGNFSTSSVHTLHDAGHREVGTISIRDLSVWAQGHDQPYSIPTAFVAWSKSGGHYMLGLYRRRFAEVLVYSGWDAKKAFDLVEGFNG